MADITSRDFQELIKRQKETTDSLQTIIQQNDRSDDAGERLKDALPEIINAVSYTHLTLPTRLPV